MGFPLFFFLVKHTQLSRDIPAQHSQNTHLGRDNLAQSSVLILVSGDIFAHIQTIQKVTALHLFIFDQITLEKSTNELSIESSYLHTAKCFPHTAF